MPYLLCWKDKAPTIVDNLDYNYYREKLLSSELRYIVQMNTDGNSFLSYNQRDWVKIEEAKTPVELIAEYVDKRFKNYVLKTKEPYPILEFGELYLFASPDCRHWGDIAAIHYKEMQKIKIFMQTGIIDSNTGDVQQYVFSVD